MYRTNNTLFSIHSFHCKLSNYTSNVIAVTVSVSVSDILVLFYIFLRINLTGITSLNQLEAAGMSC